MNNANWVLNDGGVKTDCSSFPFAFRNMFHIVRKRIEAKQSPATASKNLTIQGPPHLRNGIMGRDTYSYASATQMAKDQGLLTLDGQINNKEFKRR